MRTYNVSLELRRESLSDFKVTANRISEARVYAQREKRVFARLRGIHAGHLRAIVKVVK